MKERQTTQNPEQMSVEKTIEYYKKNAEEDYITTPISVLRYITELEEEEVKPQPQDNGLRKALIDVESLILDKNNHKDGFFNEFPLVLSVIKMALNSKSI